MTPDLFRSVTDKLNNYGKGMSVKISFAIMQWLLIAFSSRRAVAEQFPWKCSTVSSDSLQLGLTLVRGLLIVEDGCSGTRLVFEVIADELINMNYRLVVWPYG